jgi:superfamily I DNA/RNA helicase
MANRRKMVIEGASMATTKLDSYNESEKEELDDLAAAISADSKQDKISGPCSHIVSVKYDSGAFREYNLNAEVEQLQIAYASTTHKAQGAEMPTAIIVVHHANKFMLSRENFYTAVTRAKERVIILYTQLGLRIALSKQKISGRNLADKTASYLKMMGGEEGVGFKTVTVRLSEDD